MTSLVKTVFLEHYTLYCLAIFLNNDKIKNNLGGTTCLKQIQI